MAELLAPKVIIFSQGDEVITGATVDTNAAYLADHCRALGFNIIRHITVADEMDDLVQVLRDIDVQADICLCTGGLGPTQDDLTTKAFSKAFNTKLVFDDMSLTMMQEYFAKLDADMPALNRKQAYLPSNATRIDNHWGTAPGFMAKGTRCQFYCMPGVPYEMKNMMHSFVLESLRNLFKVEKTQLITLRITGMGESAIQQEIDKLSIADDVRISFRAGSTENELKLIFPNACNEQQIKACVDDVKQVLGGSVFAVDGLGKDIKSLPDYVRQLMMEKNHSLGLIETITQGDIARQCDSNYLIKSLIFPQVSGIMSRFTTQGESIDELAVLNIAQQEHTNNDESITLVQLYQTTGEDHALVVYTAVVDNERASSATKTIKGRLERQRVIASTAAFNVLRKHLLED